MTSLLSVRDLTTTFATDRGVVRAVDGVSFDLDPGETLGLVGESGSGKTVTALSLLRLVPEPPGRIHPPSEIVFDGRDLLGLGPAALREVRGAQIAMVFQEPAASLNPVLSVGAHIVEVIRAHETTSRRDARRRALDLLELVGIPDAAQRMRAYPHQLSGGMAQRVTIALALACRPRLLIADEPTTALDVTIQAQILDLLRDVQRRFGMAMLFVTHDLGVLAGIADRIAVMYGGRIVETGDAATVFHRPAHPYTEGLLRAIPRMDRPTDRLADIPGTVPSAAAWPPGCRFHPRCGRRLPRCANDVPVTTAVDPGHTTACWLTEPATP